MDYFLNVWQHLPSNINPVLFQIGRFKLYYYGLMYIVAFTIVYYLTLFRVKKEKRFNVSENHVQDLMVNMMLGVIVGGRLGYVLFYNLSHYLKHPLEIILPFNFSSGITFTGISGMSYHGGLICVILFAWLYVRKNKLNFRDIADLFIPVIPLGYTFGRLGNFINGELYGRATSSPIGMYFPPEPELRHPSQLYEAFFEGIFLFAVLWYVRKKQKTRGAMIGFYLIGYGSVRFIIEFFRQPDSHIGFVFFKFSMGQVLCSIMIVGGFFVYFYLRGNFKFQLPTSK
ncbi:MAG: prolipoprotein diacylglyceryl transferase [Desulfobacteraceae bacterium]|nr:prolipoprotein diacylglyceryl transferase [Desulfobacteraceae bacterium]